MNPGGSSKDRVALQVVLDAIRSGELPPPQPTRPGHATSPSSKRCPLQDYEATIYEGTSGSTGISLAMLSRAFGYKCGIVLPDDTAKEKSGLLYVRVKEIKKFLEEGIMKKLQLME